MTQLERADLHAAIETRYPDNTSEDITPLRLREGLHELVDSVFVTATDTGAVPNVPLYVPDTFYVVGYTVRYTPLGGQEGFYAAKNTGKLTAPGPGNLIDWKVVPGPVVPTDLSQSLTLSQAQGLDQAGVVAGRDYLIDCGPDAKGNTQMVTVRGLANEFFDVEGTLEVNGVRTAITDFKVQAGTWTVKQYSRVTATQQAALSAANAPSTANPVATLADLSLHFTDVGLLPDSNQVYHLPADIRGKRFLLNYPAATATIQLPAAFTADSIGAAFCLRLNANGFSPSVPIFTVAFGNPLKLDVVGQAGDALLLAIQQPAGGPNFYYSLAKLAATAGDLNTIATTLPLASAHTANYTLALPDAGCLVPVLSSSPVLLTVPDHTSVAFPVGTTLYVAQDGTGTVTIAPAPGVVVQTAEGYRTPGQWQEVALHKRDLNTWVLKGGVA